MNLRKNAKMVVILLSLYNLPVEILASSHHHKNRLSARSSAMKHNTDFKGVDDLVTGLIAGGVSVHTINKKTDEMMKYIQGSSLDVEGVRLLNERLNRLKNNNHHHRHEADWINCFLNTICCMDVHPGAKTYKQEDREQRDALARNRVVRDFVQDEIYEKHKKRSGINLEETIYEEDGAEDEEDEAFSEDSVSVE